MSFHEGDKVWVFGCPGVFQELPRYMPYGDLAEGLVAWVEVPQFPGVDKTMTVLVPVTWLTPRTEGE